MRCTTEKDDSETPFMLPTRSLLEEIIIKHAGRNIPAAVKFIIVAVRVVLLVMGFKCIVFWLQVIRMSAVVGLDFVVVSLSRNKNKTCDKIGPIANENVWDFFANGSNVGGRLYLPFNLLILNNIFIVI